jgi:pimeloyl-ACP methyl ester carboxylesterase
VGLGIFLAYDAYERFQSEARVADMRAARAEDRLPPDAPRAPAEPALQLRWDDVDWQDLQPVGDPERRPGDRRKWAALLGAVLCLGISVGGRWPAKYLLSSNSQAAAPELTPVSTTTVERPDGSCLHVQAFGRAPGPTLLLTHGWSLDVSDWADLLQLLADRYHVVTWDLPGLGKSTGPANGDYQIEKMADDLEAVRAQVVGSHPVIFVGHSIGGMIQQTYCRLHRDKLKQPVAGVALVHTTYTNPLQTNLWAPLTVATQPVLKALNALQIPLAGLFWLTNWQSFLNGSLHVSSRIGSFSGRQSAEQLDRSALLAAKAWPAVVARGNMAMTGFNEEASLPEIEIPVLIIAGENDRLTVSAASDRLESLLPEGKRVDDAGGHLGTWEYPQHVAETLLKFADHCFAANSPASLAPAAPSPNPQPPKH